jgi:hypothetical protein
MSVGDWEQRLCASLEEVRLIGEVNLSRDEFAALAESMRGMRAGHLARRYPCAFATFLVYCGIHEYEHGAFWDGVKRVLSPDMMTSELGQEFERFLDARRLEDFPHFTDEHAQRYVSRILAHGGVPDYCLGDFFDLLHYTLQRPDWAALPAVDLITEWQSRQFSFVQIDKPIQRFLASGGSTARDFLQRSLDMVEDALETGGPVIVHETGLPVRIGEGFNSWRERRTVTTHRSGAATRARFVSPRISFDPWSGEGLILRLPPQPLTDTARHATWQIGFGQRTMAVDCSPLSSAQLTHEVEIVLDEPAPRWDVTLLVDGSEVSSWRFAGLSAHRPILVIDPRTQELIRWTDALPSGDQWLIYPDHAVLSIRSQAKVQPLAVGERFPTLWGHWRGFRGADVQLAVGGTLLLPFADPATRPIEIPIQARDPQAGRPKSDIDVHVVASVSAGDERLPVVRRAPTLLIPAGDDGTVVPSRWTIVLAPRDGSVPGSRVVRTIDQLDWSPGPAGSLIIDLAQTQLLPAGSIGTYALTVRGPLGQDARFDFALVSGLTVRGHDSHATFNRDLDAPATVEMDWSVPVIPLGTDAGVVVRRRPDGADAEGTGRSLAIRLIPAASSTQHPAVDLRVPLAGLRWAIIGIADGRLLEWNSHAVRLPQDAVVGSGATALLFEGFSSDLATATGSMRVVLRDAAKRSLQEVIVDVRHSRAWLPLGSFNDTLRVSDDAWLTFSVDIFGPAGEALAVDREVLRVTRDLVVNGLQLSDTTSNEGIRRITVRWQQPWRVNDRVLRLWPLDRPWNAPVSIEIPDEISSAYDVELAEEQLPAGHYRAEIAVCDPWLGSLEARPSSEASVDIQIGSSAEIQYRASQPVTSSVDILEQFLLTGDSVRLARLGMALEHEDAGPALRVLAELVDIADADVLADESNLEAAIVELRDALIDHPGLCQAIIGARGSVGTTTDGLLRLIATLGIPQSSVVHVRQGMETLQPVDQGALERQFPWLYLCRMGGRLVTSDTSRSDAETLLGNQPLHMLLPPIEIGTTRNVPWGGRHDQIVDSFGRFADPGSYRLPLTQIEAIRQFMELVPAGALDTAAYDLATFEWLVTLTRPRNAARRDDIEEWLATATARMEMALYRLASAADGTRLRAASTGILAAISIVQMRSLAGISSSPVWTCCRSLPARSLCCNACTLDSLTSRWTPGSVTGCCLITAGRSPRLLQCSTSMTSACSTCSPPTPSQLSLRRPA